MYRVEFAKRAARQFRNLNPDVQRQLDLVIRGLAHNPRPPGCKKLSDSIWRVRSGNYRIIYQVEDKRLTVLVVKIADRKEAYR